MASTSHRFESAEIDFLKRFLGKTEEYDIPVIIVLTKSLSKKDAEEMVKEIEKEALPVKKILPILAEDYTINDELSIKAYGLDTLLDITYKLIPEALKKTFLAVQKVNLELKKQEARKLINATAVAAAATGAAPIPFSDAPLLVTEQIGMMAKMTVIFGIPLDKSSITAIFSGLLGTSGATVAGKTIVSNILKLIPGAGSVAGGVISGSTAAVLTKALGEAYLIVLLKVYSGELSPADLFTDDVKKQFTELFKEILKKQSEQKD